MLAYNKTYEEFCEDIRLGQIDKAIVSALNRDFSESEKRAFRISLGSLRNALSNVDIPNDVQVGVELKVPLTNRRIDFIIAGEDAENKKNVIIVELKQWTKVQHTDMYDIVLLGKEQHVHPSWQAFSYSTTISNFNEYVETHPINIYSCAFLHDYDPKYENEICNAVYSEGLKQAPAFINDQWVNFANFIGSKIAHKSDVNLLYEISNGRIKPSKFLVDCLSSSIRGNKELELIDQQRIVYSNLLKEIKAVKQRDPRKVIIVYGGAGTGKSLIALQLLGELHQQGLSAFYVAKSSYIKEAYYKKLTRDIPDYKVLRTLFRGSGEFHQAGNNTAKQFDCLIVDEAHRLTAKTKKSFMYYGENQIQEIIHASRCSIFFLDETQQIDIKDYGTRENIIAAAEAEGATVIEDKRFVLKEQFRCNGSDEYMAWVESLLYNRTFEPGDEEVTYDIKLFDNLSEMNDALRQRNDESELPSRMLSGDVFPWRSMKDKTAVDIIIGDYQAQWNKNKYFAVDHYSFDEVGCIHTAQGMEFNYVGLIVGNDLIYRDGEVKTDFTKHPITAGEFRRPHQKYAKPEDYNIIDRLIRNTYKVLFTRGQKGLYLYVMDDELREYIRGRITELQRNSQ